MTVHISVHVHVCEGVYFVESEDSRSSVCVCV